MRKIALIGTAPTVRFAPWADRSWEVWAHASAGRVARRVDRYVDLHPPHVFQDQRKNGRLNYYEWLKALRTPIYMQEHYPEIPASVRYPRERILAEFLPYVSSTGAWMVALALTEGATTIGCFGMHYSFGSEYAEQRAGFEFWLGVASGRGCRLVTPEGCPLLREPVGLYGYETHATPADYAARKARFKGEIRAVTPPPPPFDPTKLVPLSKAQALATFPMEAPLNPVLEAALERLA